MDFTSWQCEIYIQIIYALAHMNMQMWHIWIGLTEVNFCQAIISLLFQEIISLSVTELDKHVLLIPHTDQLDCNEQAQAYIRAVAVLKQFKSLAQVFN